MKKEFAKKFIGSVAAYIAGAPLQLEFVGNSQSIVIAKNVVNASKQLFESLQVKNPMMDCVKDNINTKHIAANAFKQHFGFSWPL